MIPELCECFSWERVGGKSDELLNHHPTCPHRDKYDGVADFASRVAKTFEWWAAQEDGIPLEVQAIYSECLMLAGTIKDHESERRRA